MFDTLPIPEFVLGYLSHLRELMHDASIYPWEGMCNYHGNLMGMMEQNELTWADRPLIQKLLLQYAWQPSPACTAYQAQAQTTHHLPCLAFQSKTLQQVPRNNWFNSSSPHPLRRPWPEYGIRQPWSLGCTFSWSICPYHQLTRIPDLSSPTPDLSCLCPVISCPVSSALSSAALDPMSMSSPDLGPMPMSSPDLDLLPMSSADLDPMPTYSADLDPLPMSSADLDLMPTSSGDLDPLPMSSIELDPLLVSSTDLDPLPESSADLDPLLVSSAARHAPTP